MTITYAGIGSRNTPGEIARLMRKIGALSAVKGFHLRSGGADGADTAFEDGVNAILLAFEELRGFSGEQALQRIYLPWEGFNGRHSTMGATHLAHPMTKDLVYQYHPAGDRLKKGPMALMRRNCHQVLGDHLTEPASYIICWTPDGVSEGQVTSQKTGGTGMAIRIASAYGVPVFNLKNSSHRERLKSWVDREEQVLDLAGRTLDDILDSYLAQYEPGRIMTGDVVSAAQKGEIDVLVHGCNCQNKMGSGVAKKIREVYPAAFSADAKTLRGDKRKLGDYSYAVIERENQSSLVVINAYTQYRYGHRAEGDAPFLDLQAVKKFASSLVEKNPELIVGKKIGMPKIGAGLAGGDWPTIASIFKREWSAHANISTYYFNDDAPGSEINAPLVAQGELGL